MNLFFENSGWLLFIIIIWILPLKGYALWTASRRDERGWFIALLIINTFGILEIFYLFFIEKKKLATVFTRAKNVAGKLID